MLPKQDRLSKEKDIMLVLRRGRRFSSPFLNLNFFKNRMSVSRFGFIVSKKVAAKPTQRNLIKRRMRNIVGKNQRDSLSGFDCLFVAKAQIKSLDYKETEEELLRLLGKAGVLKKLPIFNQ